MENLNFNDLTLKRKVRKTRGQRTRERNRRLENEARISNAGCGETYVLYQANSKLCSSVSSTFAVARIEHPEGPKDSASSFAENGNMKIHITTSCFEPQINSAIFETAAQRARSDSIFLVQPRAFMRPTIKQMSDTETEDCKTENTDSEIPLPESHTASSTSTMVSAQSLHSSTGLRETTSTVSTIIDELRIDPSSNSLFNYLYDLVHSSEDEVENSFRGYSSDSVVINKLKFEL